MTKSRLKDGGAPRGFTLIELLVVIAIIAILASILFPVFARARENARRTSCASNLKQLGLGIMQYVQDYDETYPMSLNYGADGVSGGSGDDADVTWTATVQPYVKSTQIFQCPSSETVSYSTGDYGANYSVMPFSTISPNHIKMSALQSASTIYMVMDFGIYYARVSNVKTTSGTNWDYLPGMGDGGATCRVTPTTTMDRVADCQSGRHFGGVNMAFADGHVKWLKSSTVVEEANKPNATSAWIPGH